MRRGDEGGGGSPEGSWGFKLLLLWWWWIYMRHYCGWQEITVQSAESVWAVFHAII